MADSGVGARMIVPRGAAGARGDFRTTARPRRAYSVTLNGNHDPRHSMNPTYVIHDTSAVFTPALIFYKDLIRQNIARAVEMAGAPGRLRPHVKTHKTREIARM